MSLRRIGLCLLLCLPMTAWAQRVLVLPFSGDARGTLREQIEAELRKSGKSTLVPLVDLDVAASKAKKKTDGSAILSTAVALAPTLRLSAVVHGTVAEQLGVRILDSAGSALWSKELPLVNRSLGGDNARRLAAAIDAAARTGSLSVAADRPTPSGEATRDGGVKGDAVALAQRAPVPLPVEVPDPTPPAPLRLEEEPIRPSPQASPPASQAVPPPAPPPAPYGGWASPSPGSDAGVSLAPLVPTPRPSPAPPPSSALPPLSSGPSLSTPAPQFKIDILPPGRESPSAQKVPESAAPPAPSPWAQRPPSEIPSSPPVPPPPPFVPSAPPTSAVPPPVLPPQEAPTLREAPGFTAERLETSPLADDPASTAPRRTTRPKSMGPPGTLNWAGEAPRRAPVARPRKVRGTSGATGARVAPSTVSLRFGATGTLRSYCARPGVTSCGAYDAMASDARPSGQTADFDWRRIYPGGSLFAEVFPVAFIDNALKGLGLLGAYSRGFSWADQPGLTAGGEPTRIPVYSIDQRWHVLAAYRWYFSFAKPKPVPGYVGAHAGYVQRSFVPGRPASVFLPSTFRNLWAIGVDFRVPVHPLARLELTGSWYFNAGVALADAAPLGTQTGSFGASVGGGVSGDFAGPLGYWVHADWMRFDDVFEPAGLVWSSGGSATESFVTVSGGLSLSF
ncbi:MAG: hypothetical protein ACKVPX_08640 [Myxococcaceae bacterium]